MLDNYVYKKYNDYESGNLEFTPFEVTEIIKVDSKTISILKQQEKDRVDEQRIGVIRIEPIPITRDFLKKNKFKEQYGDLKIDEHSEIYVYYNEYAHYIEKMQVYDCGDGSWVLNANNGDYRTFMNQFRIKIKSVHELQQILSVNKFLHQIKL